MTENPQPGVRAAGAATPGGAAPEGVDLRTVRLHEPTRALQQLRHSTDRATAALARRLDLPLSDLHALEHLIADGGLGPAELSRRLELTTAAATSLVDRLEAKGHVVRTAVDGDRRRRDVSVTGSGEAEALAALVPLVLALDTAADGLTEAEEAVVSGYLARVIAAYEEYAAE